MAYTQQVFLLSTNFYCCMCVILSRDVCGGLGLYFCCCCYGWDRTKKKKKSHQKKKSPCFVFFVPSLPWKEEVVDWVGCLLVLVGLDGIDDDWYILIDFQLMDWFIWCWFLFRAACWLDGGAVVLCYHLIDTTILRVFIYIYFEYVLLRITTCTSSVVVW